VRTVEWVALRLRQTPTGPAHGGDA
jgi:hypothetical protein